MSDLSLSNFERESRNVKARQAVVLDGGGSQLSVVLLVELRSGVRSVF